jgi:hypothetical protein
MVVLTVLVLCGCVVREDRCHRALRQINPPAAHQPTPPEASP